MGKSLEEKHKAEKRQSRRFNGLFGLTAIVLIVVFIVYLNGGLGWKYEERDNEKSRATINTCSVIAMLYSLVFAVFFFFAFNFLSPLDKAVDDAAFWAFIVSLVLMAVASFQYVFSKQKDDIDEQTIVDPETQQPAEFTYKKNHLVGIYIQLALMILIFLGLLWVFANRDYCTTSHH